MASRAPSTKGGGIKGESEKGGGRGGRSKKRLDHQDGGRKRRGGSTRASVVGAETLGVDSTGEDEGRKIESGRAFSHRTADGGNLKGVIYGGGEVERKRNDLLGKGREGQGG